MASFGSVKAKKEYALLEQGEYVLTLSELEESAGNYGDRMTWKFLVSSPADYTAYYSRDGSDQALTIWCFTDRDIILGGLAHQLVEAITQKPYGLDSDPPSDVDLVGGRCIGYIAHETPTRGKSAGVKREKITEGSIKPFRIPAPKAAANGTAAVASVTQVSADPTSDEIDRATVVSKLQKQTARLLKLDPKEGEKAQEAVEESDLADAPLADLQALLDAVTEAVATALDA